MTFRETCRNSLSWFEDHQPDFDKQFGGVDNPVDTPCSKCGFALIQHTKMSCPNIARSDYLCKSAFFNGKCSKCPGYIYKDDKIYVNTSLSSKKTICKKCYDKLTNQSQSTVKEDIMNVYLVIHTRIIDKVRSIISLTPTYIFAKDNETAKIKAAIQITNFNSDTDRIEVSEVHFS